ncbi:MAG: extensin family protein [Proteobacteria bacterium]|nr:extensin family protein [Pseudomonadota bacterium]
MPLDPRHTAFLLLVPALLAASSLEASARQPDLPAQAPIPQLSPLTDAPQPKPDQRPAEQAAIPIPQPRPDGPSAPRAAPGEMFGPPAPQMLPDARSHAQRPVTMPAEETACRARLKQLGAEFDESPAQSAADGCALPFPLKLKRLSRSVDLEPDAVVNCATAEASVRFAADVIAPAAKAEFGDELASIGQASGYVCRPRNGTRKLSEHAFGNALDISGFTLSKGKEIEVEPAPPQAEAKFLAAVRKAACGPFKTVLGPGSDADHSRHFHFDLAPRRNGGTFCQ